nr:MAG TPA: chitin synthase regulator [Caudoviricetes sp.]
MWSGNFIMGSILLVFILIILGICFCNRHKE